MSELLVLLDSDIKRCEQVLKINNYLEIVIAVEELLDKYKDYIDDIGTDSDRIWNYTKKDLENIMDKLKSYRNKFINEYNKSRIESINTDLKTMLKNTKDEIENNKELSKHKVEEIIDILNNIQKISNEKISINDKWTKLRGYMNWLSKENVKVATLIIKFINEVLQEN